jgi:hypothetical protein
MTDILIQEKIKDIKNATEKAAASKKTATEFLLAAGIIQLTQPTGTPQPLQPVLDNSIHK